MNVHSILVILAIVCFVFGALRVATPVDMMLLGFAFLAGTLLV